VTDGVFPEMQAATVYNTNKGFQWACRSQQSNNDAYRHMSASAKCISLWQAELTFFPFLDIQNNYSGYPKKNFGYPKIYFGYP